MVRRHYGRCYEVDVDQFLYTALYFLAPGKRAFSNRETVLDVLATPPHYLHTLGVKKTNMTESLLQREEILEC
jgi:hypothetical protein